MSTLRARKGKTSSLTCALLETGKDMASAGILDKADYDKITLRLDLKNNDCPPAPFALVNGGSAEN